MGIIAEENYPYFIDDTKTASPEELAKYPWTADDERKMAQIIQQAFKGLESRNEPPETPTNPLNVAKYVLERQGNLTGWQLEKLCYYAQAWHYTWTGKRLISDEFQAWRHGPVCPKLFQTHKGRHWVSVDNIDGKSDVLSEDAKDSIDVMLEHYGHLSGDELEELTHSEEPWIKARDGVPPEQNSNTIITLESMGEYYRQHLI